jgi:putative FmdB family regulatory protein
MPTYEYKCAKGHVFDVVQRMADDPITKCEKCGAPVQRVFHPVAVHFKGSGFYNTDYGTKKRKRELEKAASDGADKHEDKQASKAKEKTKETSASSSSSGDSGSSSSSSSSGSSSGSKKKSD